MANQYAVNWSLWEVITRNEGLPSLREWIKVDWQDPPTCPESAGVPG